MYSDGWLGLDLTTLARREIRRGEQSLHVSRLRRGQGGNKYAFVDIVSRYNDKVKNSEFIGRIIYLFCRKRKA